MKLGGQMVIDSLWFSQNAPSRQAVGDVPDAFDFRRARLYAQGEYGSYNYATGFDFAHGSGTNGRPSFLDNYIGLTDIPAIQNIRIGHFFEPFTLERSSSNRNSTFMERSLADAFAPARNIGIMLFGQNDLQSVYYALGTFRSDTDNFGDDAGDQEGQSIDGRLVYRPYYDEASDGRYYMHLGSAYIYRSSADGVTQYRSRPEAFGNSDQLNPTTPYFVDTGKLATVNSQLLGTEFLWVNGPLSVQSEYVYAPVNRSYSSDVGLHGGYVYTSLFLTGEHRPYNRATATMDRVKPIHNFSPRSLCNGGRSGIGAWELAARLSFIDLSDRDVDGGNLRDLTLGANWYATPYHRLKFNYILANLVRNQAHTDTTIFGLRFDTDF
jgi:phosphate-selective porin OprO/OprP